MLTCPKGVDCWQMNPLGKRPVSDGESSAMDAPPCDKKVSLDLRKKYLEGMKMSQVLALLSFIKQGAE